MCPVQRKPESPLRSGTAESIPDHGHQVPAEVHIPGKHGDTVSENLSKKRKRIPPMDPTFDKTLSLWIEHGKISLEQLEEWITKKQSKVPAREISNGIPIEIEFTTSNPSTEFWMVPASQIQTPRVDHMRENVAFAWSLVRGSNQSEHPVRGRSLVSSTSSEGYTHLFVD